ncbi:hypothetical protein K493DRAFT_295361 [Basidiobolus meristosporus CBS 931.73]|uniref:G-protein coupled receptors family 2 profile 2 domain-containing protein n=1 Tax=Basidiobolus meristosporus CBS 931.73 TaxID=1314790 RepID=A0A1Y1ZC17_9FUNG|nr:hypothetical protein K493DRAFT_295361 [Basidiobolus meristosporus CBS 931.73]|eukprot:ORY07726.1 hypothetical protein K493DRAFT_295361 [Basidiobolus meristosporus CBS 931.73]
MAFSATAFLLLLGLKYYDRHLVNRVSLRLNKWMALVDVGFCGAQILNVQNNNDSIWCALSVWLIVWFTLLYLFLNTMIAFNLQIVFVHGKSNTSSYVKYYYIISFSLSLIISLTPFFEGKYGYYSIAETCWWTNSYTSKTILWEWMTYLGWIAISVLYCTIAVSLVIYKLVKESRIIREQIQHTASHELGSEWQGKTNIDRDVLKAVRRIVLYPIIPIFTQGVNIMQEMDVYVHREANFYLFFLAYFAGALQGTFNTLVFLFDPAVVHAYKRIHADLSDRYASSLTSSNTLDDVVPWKPKVVLWCLKKCQLSDNANTVSESETIDRPYIVHLNPSRNSDINLSISGTEESGYNIYLTSNLSLEDKVIQTTERKNNDQSEKPPNGIPMCL